MKIALVNPPWTLDGSIRFGCREPHLPLEYGYAKALLERAGHEAVIFDAHFFQFSIEELRHQVAEYRPDMTTIATAPSYPSWRCPPPELGMPQQVVAALRDVAGKIVAVGPHGSITPRTTMEKLGVDVVALGECEEVLVELAGRPAFEWSGIEGITYSERGKIRGHGAPRMARLDKLPALRWSDPWIAGHGHHHHRFHGKPVGPGAEIEASRGCPFRWSFGTKQRHRDSYRKRRLGTTLDELDGLLAQGVRYVYFMDEMFLPDQQLLEALAARDFFFGVQTRIGNWDKGTLDLLGRAGCVSVEASVERLTEQGLLIHAKRRIAFVQANLLESGDDDPDEVESWCARLRAHGVWTHEPMSSLSRLDAPDDAVSWPARAEPCEQARL